MPQAKVAVVIPTYHELTDLEKISLAQCRKVLGKYPIIFVAPEDKNFSYFQPGDMIAHFPPQYFKNLRVYNRLMLSPTFYEAFRDFEYILLYQLDAFVFYDALETFCAFGYDYIGAPWPMIYTRRINGKRPRVGNGGFSLRKVEACYSILVEHADFISQFDASQISEDTVFAYCGLQEDINFNVAPIDIAYKFSVEFHPARVVKKNGGLLPFGCHDWIDQAPEFYIKTFRQFGYDLLPLKDMLNDVSASNVDLTNFLKHLAIKHLIWRTNRGQSIIRYLPVKRFASVRVIHSPQAMKVLNALFIEDKNLAEKIFIYDNEDQSTLVNSLSRENLPHLILTLLSNDDLTEILEQRGFVYGKHFISFQREYLNRCEELFHNLGK